MPTLSDQCLVFFGSLLKTIGLASIGRRIRASLRDVFKRPRENFGGKGLQLWIGSYALVQRYPERPAFVSGGETEVISLSPRSLIHFDRCNRLSRACHDSSPSSVRDYSVPVARLVQCPASGSGRSYQNLINQQNRSRNSERPTDIDMNIAELHNCSGRSSIFN